MSANDIFGVELTSFGVGTQKTYNAAEETLANIKYVKSTAEAMLINKGVTADMSQAELQEIIAVCQAGERRLSGVAEALTKNEGLMVNNDQEGGSLFKGVDGGLFPGFK